MSSDKKITIEGIQAIKDQLGDAPVTTGGIKVIEAPLLPPSTMMASTDLFEAIKKEIKPDK